MSLRDGPIWTRFAAQLISFIGEQTRWTTGGEHRECVWCGKVTQRRETWIEPVARERWVTQKSA